MPSPSATPRTAVPAFTPHRNRPVAQLLLQVTASGSGPSPRTQQAVSLGAPSSPKAPRRQLSRGPHLPAGPQSSAGRHEHPQTGSPAGGGPEEQRARAMPRRGHLLALSSRIRRTRPRPGSETGGPGPGRPVSREEVQPGSLWGLRRAPSGTCHTLCLGTGDVMSSALPNRLPGRRRPFCPRLCRRDTAQQGPRPADGRCDIRTSTPRGPAPGRALARSLPTGPPGSGARRERREAVPATPRIPL